ncbi:NAD-dependent epimerase/dehydratase family protein [Candidatus Aenigmatarchaeota archaeon]
MTEKILVTGSVGQIGSELTMQLRDMFGNENVIATGHKTKPSKEMKESGPFEIIDAVNKNDVEKIVKKYEITSIYHLISILSAKGETMPNAAWDVNTGTLKNVLDVAIENDVKKIFWPSSIAAFGPNTPRESTPQLTVMDPNTMYGVTKVAGELLCNYYFTKYGLDVRSVRYPGILSWKTPPGGGTTDYAVAVFYEALQNKKYTFFVNEQTILPMMYMPDAIKATIDIMGVDPSKIKTRTSYNLAAISFSAKELEEEVKKHVPELVCKYEPDQRQQIADSWPKTIDDSAAREDWGWSHEFTLEKMTKDMIENLKKKFK